MASWRRGQIRRSRRHARSDSARGQELGRPATDAAAQNNETEVASTKFESARCSRSPSGHSLEWHDPPGDGCEDDDGHLLVPEGLGLPVPDVAQRVDHVLDVADDDHLGARRVRNKFEQLAHGACAIAAANVLRAVLHGAGATTCRLPPGAHAALRL